MIKWPPLVFSMTLAAAESKVGTSQKHLDTLRKQLEEKNRQRAALVEGLNDQVKAGVTAAKRTGALQRVGRETSPKKRP